MSTDPNFKKTVLLVFANHADAHLSMLEKESQTLQQIFEELGTQRPLNLSLLEQADTEAISKKLLEEKNTVIFHYAGHAGGESLHLKDGLGFIEGLSPMLGRMKKLKLVFLNGCATHDMVKSLFKNNVKAVIATNVPVSDRAAFEFSKAFYESFVKGNTLEESYKHACDFLNIKYKNLLSYQINKRSIGLMNDPEELAEESKWALFYQDPDVLAFSGVGSEPEKIKADFGLIREINSFNEKIPIRILLAASIHERLPNGRVSPINVYNEVALIKEYIYKLFIYSNFSYKFDVEVYLLKNRKQASLIVKSGELVGVRKDVDLLNLSDFHLISWIIWDNLGEAKPGEVAPLDWLYDQVFQLEEKSRPPIQIFRRAEAILSSIVEQKSSEHISITDRVNEVEKFFSKMSDKRIIDYHPDLFEEEFEHHLRIWLKNFLRGSRSNKDVLLGKPKFKNPYRGLEPYQYEDAGLFYGRINEVDQLRDQLADSQHEGLLAVIGASGSGKSSLVRAGLLNRLQLGTIPGSENWRIIECKLDEEYWPCNEVWGEDSLISFTLHEYVKNGREGVGLLIRELMEHYPKDARLVLFFDQFEEIFTLISEDREDDRKDLLNFIVKFAQIDQGQVILTMRSEYFHRCLDYPDFTHLLKKGQQVVLAPDEESIFRIISRPAMFSGLQFEDELEMRIMGETGSLEGTLPLLSYLLEQLVEKRNEDDRLTKDAYDSLGGVAGVIQRQADLAVEQFDLDEDDFKKNFNFLFRKLITVENGVEGKRPAPLDTTHWPQGAKDLKNNLTDQRLLITDDKSLEIAHEALIRNWDLLQSWILDTKDAQIILAKAGKEAEEWYIERETLTSEEEIIRFDKNTLWPQDKLERVYEAQERMGFDDTELEKLYPHILDFIRPESDRLIEELTYDFTDHGRREEIGNRLAQLIDARPGVGLKNGLPDIVWCKVPGGKVFVPGIEMPFHVEPFYIARYPVTLAQFKVFEKKELFKQASWWEGLPKEIQWECKPRTQSQDNMINRPAEMVNWYQAVVFCRWLGTQLGYTIRLPYEWEWQQAACNGNPNNSYPWGKYWDHRKANHSQGVGSLIAVGMYPHGMTENGVLDMAGNAYEWCYNAYSIEEQSLQKNVKRTTKGGSWASFDGAPEDVLKNTHRFADCPTGINDNGQDVRACFRMVADKLPDWAQVYQK